MPLFLVLTYKRLTKLPPQGSVVFDTVKVGKLLLARGGLRAALKGGDDFWNSAKPVSWAGLTRAVACDHEVRLTGGFGFDFVVADCGGGPAGWPWREGQGAGLDQVGRRLCGRDPEDVWGL